MARAAAPIPRITIAYGNEPLLVDRVVRTTLQHLRAQEGEVQVTTIAANGEDAAAGLREASSPNLFGDTTAVVVTGVDQATDDVDALLRLFATDPADHAWLVLTHPGGVKGKNLLDALKKAGAEQVACAQLKGKELRAYLVKEMASYKRAMTDEAVSALIDSVGQDLRLLTGAMSQLVADVEANPIALDDVRDYFAGVTGVTGFAVADAVWDRRPAEALRSLRWAMRDSGDLSVPMVMALAAGLRSIVRVAAAGPGTSEADAAREAGVPPWKVRTLRHQWSAWSGDQRRLAAAAVALAEADGAAKGGVGEGTALDPEQKLLALERLVLLTSSKTPQ
ncbi:MAG: DNA polymerase III subunit delta [Candidatus Nanopelagicales bacterium]|nr:DNA polymerase III subunit delta [Candidatus Nanopelagicales bacterium]